MSNIVPSLSEAADGGAQDELQKLRRQVALLSLDKKAFFDNLSTELRTPLNSILLLSHLLEENPEGNLTPKQVEFALVIRSSADDLLSLINELLAISKAMSASVEA